MLETSPYPLDFESLNKGDIISEERLRDVIRTKNGTEVEFQLKVLALKQEIEKRLAERGLNVTVKSTGSSLVILTDAQASEHNEKRQKFALRHFVRSHQRLINVDTKNLSEEETEVHERRLLAGGMYLSAIQNTQKQVRKLPAYNDDRPKLEHPT